MSPTPEHGAPHDNTGLDDGETVAENGREESYMPTEVAPPRETDNVSSDFEGDEENELELVEDDERSTARSLLPEQTAVQGEEETSADETPSIPDDTPSIQVGSHCSLRCCANLKKGSVLSSPRSEAFSTRSSSSKVSPTPTHRPFERRFHSRLSSSPLRPSRSVSPAPLTTHSRKSSLASVTFHGLSEQDISTAPWDVIRWTKLRKLSGQVFSEVGKRNFGRPVCVAVSSHIVIGTSRGIVLIFDYQQNLKGAIGPGTKGNNKTSRP